MLVRGLFEVFKVVFRCPQFLFPALCRYSSTAVLVVRSSAAVSGRYKSSMPGTLLVEILYNTASINIEILVK